MLFNCNVRDLGEEELQMAEIDKNVWGIHTLNDSLFLNKSVIAIGWEQMGNLSLRLIENHLKPNIQRLIQTPKRAQ